MGCKAPKEESEGPVRGKGGMMKPKGSRAYMQEVEEQWLCDCGFKNKPINEVCGGKGPMGCNEPRPDAE